MNDKEVLCDTVSQSEAQILAEKPVKRRPLAPSLHWL
jgi:hypothetical protein